MKKTRGRALVGIAIFVCLASGPRLFAQALHTNLLANPGAELSTGAPNFATTAPPQGWNTTSSFTAVQYAVGGANDLNGADAAAFGGGNNYFAGGPNSASSTAKQTISLAALAGQIDGGGELQAVMSGFFGGFGGQNDDLRMVATFRDGNGGNLKSFTIGAVTATQRGNQSQLLFRANAAEIPAGTRSVEIMLVATNVDIGYNDGYADNLSFQVTETVTAKPVAGEFYYTTFGNANEWGYGSFTWDGTSLFAFTRKLKTEPALLFDGSLAVGADGNIYSGRAGRMCQLDPRTRTKIETNTNVNSNVTSIDPPRTTVYAGWKDTRLSTLATGAAFGPGTPHNITGSETVATGLAWLPDGQVWYTTGGEDRLGNVGRINLTTFNTTRVLSGVSATSITYDPFTGHIFTAGIDGIAQIDPVAGQVVSTWKNPQGGAVQYISSLAATGQGHLVVVDGGNGLLRLWDMSSGSHLIGSPDTIEATAPTPVFSGGLALADVPDFVAIISPLAVKARVGQQFTYVIETNTPVSSYSANTLPPGLTFGTVPRAITGTPTQAGTFQVPLSVTGGAGTANETLTISVDPASAAQLISGTSATARNGGPFRFQVISTGGSPASRVTATNLPTGLTLDSMTGVISGTPTLDGSFAVTLTLAEGAQTSTSTLQLTVTSDPAVPVIISPNTTLVTPGQNFSYTIVAPTSTSASDPTIFQLIGNLPPGFTFDPGTGTISGISVAAASYSREAEPNKPTLSGGIVGNVQLFARNSSGTGTIPLVFFLAPTGAVNISTRMSVGLGDNVMIGGFIITGNAPKAVILRAIGPSLKTIPGALQDPNLDLFDGAGHLLGSNNNWRDNQENEIINTSIPPTDDRESAILAGLTPGNYTAVVSGRNGTTGIAVVEAYDLGTASLDTSSKAQLAQISTRGTVLTDDDVMIGGFIISGSATKVIVRAIGPSLNGTLSGALQDTTLDLVNGSGTIVRSNDDWETDQKQEIIDTTVPPSDTHESAVVATLNAGSYTGIVRGKGNTTGVALVEVYSLQ